MNCREKVVISWVIIAIAVSLAFIIQGNPLIQAIAVFALVALRASNEETRYWRRVGSSKNPIVLFAFIWMVCWLIFILYRYFESKPPGSNELSLVQWLSFLSVPVATLAYYEYKWFLSCQTSRSA